MSHTDNKASKWESLARTWHDTGAPASPSDGDIQIYRTFIQRAVRDVVTPQTLVLGCTPRLRTLVSELGLPATCVDISREMLARTTTLVSNHAQETLVCQDWLHMDLDGQKFSVILGDKIFDNVSHTQWSLFKERILLHMAPQGYLITRVAPQNPSLLGRSFSELLHYWSQQYLCGDISLRAAASALWEQALGASTSCVPGRQSIGVFSDDLTALNRKRDHLEKHQAQLLEEFTKLFEKSIQFEWTAYTLGNLIDALAEELVLQDLSRANDYQAAKRQPVMMFLYSVTS